MTEYLVFFDIDNCLYSASTTISKLMMQKIRQYFIDLGFSTEEAEELHSSYYRQYGLAIRGLVKHHQIDPLDFNTKCDASLPLEDLLTPDASIRKLLLDIDRSKVRVWAATNAYITHAERVLNILNLRDLVEDIISCDYADPNFVCKPEAEYFQLAMKTAGLNPDSSSDRAKCLFVDDSLSNVRGAKKENWGSSVWFRERLSDAQRAHLVSGDEAVAESAIRAPSGSFAEQMKQSMEAGDETPAHGVDAVISNLQQLREIWPFVFKPSTDDGGSSTL